MPGKDAEHNVKFRGLVIPAILVVWALLNLITMQALWPVMQGRRLSAVWVTDYFRVSMAVCVRLGIAAACFGWFFMANRDDWSYWAPLVTVLGCGAAVVAFVLGSLAFVW